MALPDRGPDGQLPELPPLFTVFVNDDASTFGPAPQKRGGFRLLEERGSQELAPLLAVVESLAESTDPPSGS